MRSIERLAHDLARWRRREDLEELRLRMEARSREHTANRPFDELDVRIEGRAEMEGRCLTCGEPYARQPMFCINGSAFSCSACHRCSLCCKCAAHARAVAAGDEGAPCGAMTLRYEVLLGRLGNVLAILPFWDPNRDESGPTWVWNRSWNYGTAFVLARDPAHAVALAHALAYRWLIEEAGEEKGGL